MPDGNAILATLLQKAGFIMEIYRVGGAVRDSLLKLPVKEQDWVVVGATPAEMQALGFRQVGRDFPVFLHPQTGEEYALARTERKQGNGHTGFVCHSAIDVTLEQDLQRRDLTINAMAETPDGNIIDPYGGRKDLDNRVLRHVSPAFAEDPLRVLRVARFFARLQPLGFQIAAETLALMTAISHSNELQTLAGERIWKELEKALGEKHPSGFFLTLEQCGALERLLPELSPPDPATMARLDHAASTGTDPAVLFSLLPATLSPGDAEALLNRLNAPRRFRDLALLVNRHGQDGLQPLSAEKALQLIQAADAFRRPQRWQQLLQACELLGASKRTINTLVQAWQAVQQISPQPFIDRGLRGPAIARALHQARLAALQGLWHEHN